MNMIMWRETIRRLGLSILPAACLTLSSCDVPSGVLWPWVEPAPNVEPSPVAPTAPDPGVQGEDALPPPPAAPPVANPNANAGAPENGTPFPDLPLNEALPISDTASPAPSPETVPPSAPGEPSPTPPDPPTDPSPAPPPPSFYFNPPGALEPSSGQGAVEAANLAPDIVFPIRSDPSVLQSQVYRYGGGMKGGDQCDPRNFSAPWRDNYCETRTTTAATPWCALKGVHLGQDIRVGTPEGCSEERRLPADQRVRYPVVAVEDGVISNVGSYSVTLRASSGGRIYRYLHLNMARLHVATGQAVRKGEVIGYVSNDFGGTPTTLHLHFEIKLNTAETGWQYAPPYAALVAAYQRREGNTGALTTDGAMGNASSAATPSPTP